MWGLAERRSSRFGRNLDMDDLYDQLDTLRGYVQELSRDVGKSAGQSYGRARDYAADAAQEAEETMKDHLAASLLVAAAIFTARVPPEAPGSDLQPGRPGRQDRATPDDTGTAA